MSACRRLSISFKDDEILRKRLVYCLSIISWVLVVVSAWYFNLFPTLVNTVFSDMFIVILIFSLLLSLVIGSFMIQYFKELIFFMPQCLLICFIARCIPYLRLSYPVLWDPYAFLVTFLNIHEFRTLEQIYSYWYPSIENLIHWPLMMIITELLSLIGGIDYMWLFNYQQPIFGMIFFLGVYLLAYSVSQNYGVSLLSGLISSLSSHVIFYQSEYHPQGYAFIILVFLLVVLSRSWELKNKLEYRIIVMIFIMAFTVSHYFSSLFISFILISLFCTLFLISLINKKYSNSRLNMFGVDWTSEIFFSSFLLIVVVLSYHFYVFSEHIGNYIHMISSANPYNAPLISVEGSIPFPTNVIKNIRLIVLLLGFGSIFYSIKTKNHGEIFLSIICILLISLGVIGNVLIFLEVGRIVAFYETLIGIFAALTLFRLRDIWLKPLNKRMAITALLCISTAGVITLTFFGGQYIPAYYFKSLGQNNYYWCENNLPDMQKYETVGEWVAEFCPSKPTILIDTTQYFMHSAIFFWGETPLDRISVFKRYPYDQNKNTFIAFNIKGNRELDKERLIEKTSRVYFNGEAVINAV